MLLGYADESGEPGRAKSSHDYFVFCIVLIDNLEKSLEIVNKMKLLRQKNNLPETHEFHYATDSKKTRALFIGFMKSLNFKFVSVSIKKNALRNTASFSNMAELVLELLSKKCNGMNVFMDTNPRLCRELCNRKKKYTNNFHFSEKKSRGNDLIQLADYVTALRTRYLKYPNKRDVLDAYKIIKNKLFGSTEL